MQGYLPTLPPRSRSIGMGDGFDLARIWSNIAMSHIIPDTIVKDLKRA